MHDRQAEATSRFRLVEALASFHHLRALLGRYARPIVFDHDHQPMAGLRPVALCRLDAHPDTLSRPLGGIVEQIAEKFLEVVVAPEE